MVPDGIISNPEIFIKLIANKFASIFSFSAWQVFLMMLTTLCFMNARKRVNDSIKLPQNWSLSFCSDFRTSANTRKNSYNKSINTFGGRWLNSTFTIETKLKARWAGTGEKKSKLMGFLLVAGRMCVVVMTFLMVNFSIFSWSGFAPGVMRKFISNNLETVKENTWSGISSLHAGHKTFRLARHGSSDFSRFRQIEIIIGDCEGTRRLNDRINICWNECNTIFFPSGNIP